MAYVGKSFQANSILCSWLAKANTRPAYAASSEPTSELHADAAYKRAMVRVFTRRAVRAALQRDLYEGNGKHLTILEHALFSPSPACGRGKEGPSTGEKPYPWHGYEAYDS